MIDASNVSIGLAVGTQPPLRRVTAFARIARALGFDVAWTVDHFLGWFKEELWDKDFTWFAQPGNSPHPFFDYQALLGHLAAKHRGLHLGVAVTEPVRRHPVLIAQSFMTLSHLSPKTPILGLGAGERENTVPYGLDFNRPVSRLEEALQIIRLCFESRGPVSFSGQFYELDRAIMDLRPPAGRTPLIWLAAHGPRMLRLTGTYADGWLPALPFTPQQYADKLATIRTAAQRAGRDSAAFVPGWYTYAVIAKSQKAARAMFDHKAVRFGALLAPDSVWREMGSSHPFGDEFGGMVDFTPQDYTKAQIEDAIARVPVDGFAERTMWGSPDDVYRRLGEYVDAGLRHVVLQPFSALVSRRDAVYSLQAMISILRKLKKQGAARQTASLGP